MCYVEYMAPPTVAPDVVRPPVSEPSPAGGPDATPDAGVAEGFRSVPASAVLPGLTAADLTPLCARVDPREQARHSRRLARRVAERMLDASGP